MREMSRTGHIVVIFEREISSMRYFMIPLLALFVFPVSTASALSATEVKACNAMAASFGPKRAEFDELTARRDALAIEVEEAGDIWEEAEALRNFSAGHATDADTKKAAYDDAVTRFDRADQAYRVTGAQLNDDFAVYNIKCATED